MPVLATKKTCTGCMVCIDSCHAKALSYFTDNDGFYSISLNKKTCIECKICEKTCPVLSNLPARKFDDFSVYAAWSKNDNIRLQSASGGVFAECAFQVLENNGIAIGATLDGKKVYHVAIDKIDELKKIQNSKYLQSNSKGIYITAKQFLKQGKIVLFSGTPCQIAGVISFLKNVRYTGELILAQVVCHGVPSSRILQLFEEIKQSEIKKIIKFRAKTNGWKNSHVFMYADNNNIEHTLTAKNNLFNLLFERDLLLRASCYDCLFLSSKGLADLSLADYWGNINHQNEHNKGLSLVIAHTDKGRDILEKSNLKLHASTWTEALPKNPRIFNGKNWAFYHPARVLLTFHLKHLPKKITEKIYANKINKTDIILYPYKFINKLLFTITKLHNWKKLKGVLRDGSK